MNPTLKNILIGIVIFIITGILTGAGVWVKSKYKDIQSIPEIKAQAAREKKARIKNDSLNWIQYVDLNTKVYIQGKWIERQQIIDSIRNNKH